ncbi:hypothetical protein QBC34DRAFT_187861 [Podospora aff. communis PSN243]|uniref:CFEM domain-containing protein n=1 Tax=Podospora aff. communis PSN243 TaxID=3040156 RepID=A0AAV9G7H5_9PEZI|nr:hypothetical protein QBC34DRAFT_187861 [Podospora aff. communis PSN243]
MKYATIVTFGAGALAQSITDLPQCGQICIGNMIALSSSLGCPLVSGYPDARCFCSKPDFGYGIRDCTAQSCPPQDIAPVANLAAVLCAEAAVLPLEPGPVVPTSMPPVLESKSPERTATSSVVSTLTSGSLTLTTSVRTSLTMVMSVPTTLILDSSVVVAKTEEDGESTMSTTTGTSVRGAGVSDVQTTSTAAPKSTSTSEAGAALVTMGAGTLFAGAAGVVAMLAL